MNIKCILADKDEDFYWGYSAYAFEIWNFIETLCDLNNAKHDKQFLIKTWRPVLLEENRLHFNWFTRNTRLFKNEFVYFVYHELNGFELRRGEKEEFSNKRSLCFIISKNVKKNKITDVKVMLR